jgi:hypothetical protein
MPWSSHGMTRKGGRRFAGCGVDALPSPPLDAPPQNAGVTPHTSFA